MAYTLTREENIMAKYTKKDIVKFAKEFTKAMDLENPISVKGSQSDIEKAIKSEVDALFTTDKDLLSKEAWEYATKVLKLTPEDAGEPEPPAKTTTRRSADSTPESIRKGSDWLSRYMGCWTRTTVTSPGSTFITRNRPRAFVTVLPRLRVTAPSLSPRWMKIRALPTASPASFTTIPETAPLR